MLHVSYLDEEDQHQHELGIEVEHHEILDPYLEIIPNKIPKPRWAQKLIVGAGDSVWNPEDRRRERSQYQNEHFSLALRDSLPTK